MNYNRRYENILNELCRHYKKMLPLIEKLEGYDKALAAVTGSAKPDVHKIRVITAHKERIIKGLDSLSIDIAKLHVKLGAISEFCLDENDTPLYRYMQRLHLEAYNGIRRINEKEDMNNPFILKQLNKLKRSFEENA